MSRNVRVNCEYELQIVRARAERKCVGTQTGERARSHLAARFLKLGPFSLKYNHKITLAPSV